MKTILAVLLGLSALCACAAPMVSKKPIPQAETRALKEVCDANRGIFVLLVDAAGQRREFKCAEIDGRPITQESERRKGVDIVVRRTELGKVTKFRAADEKDPCIDWSVGGTRYYFCW